MSRGCCGCGAYLLDRSRSATTTASRCAECGSDGNRQRGDAWGRSSGEVAGLCVARCGVGAMPLPPLDGRAPRHEFRGEALDPEGESAGRFTVPWCGARSLQYMPMSDVLRVANG